MGDSLRDARWINGWCYQQTRSIVDTESNFGRKCTLALRCVPTIPWPSDLFESLRLWGSWGFGQNREQILWKTLLWLGDASADDFGIWFSCIWHLAVKDVEMFLNVRFYSVAVYPTLNWDSPLFGKYCADNLAAQSQLVGPKVTCWSVHTLVKSTLSVVLWLTKIAIALIGLTSYQGGCLREFYIGGYISIKGSVDPFCLFCDIVRDEMMVRLVAKSKVSRLLRYPSRSSGVWCKVSYLSARSSVAALPMQ